MENHNEENFNAAVRHALSTRASRQAKWNDLWDITVFWGKHPTHGMSYAVRLQSKLNDGTCFRTYLIDELSNEKNWDRIRNELNVIGVMEVEDLLQTLERVKQKRIDDDVTNIAHLYEVIKPDSEYVDRQRMYESVCKSVLANLNLYALSETDDYTTANPGIILNSENHVDQYGQDVVAIAPETLIDILSLKQDSQNKKLKGVARSWKELGHLVWPDQESEGRLKPYIRLSPQAGSKYDRFYLLRIDGLFDRLKESAATGGTMQ